jgi:lipopolysaccharide export system protein LptA
MRTTTIATILSTILLVTTAFAETTGAGVAPAPASSPVKKVTLKAERFQSEENYMRGSGNAHLKVEYRDERLNVDLYADTIVVKERVLEAQNNVRLTHKDDKGQTRDITGAALRYDLDQRRGTLDNAQIVVEQLNFRGEQIQVQMQDKHFSMTSVMVTACARENPHFSLRARMIDVTLEDEASVRGVSLFWGKRKLFTLPRVNFLMPGASKEPRRRRSLMPTPSFNKNDGLLLRTGYTLPLIEEKPGSKQGLFANVDLGYSTQRGFRGGPSLVYRTTFASPTKNEKTGFSIALKAKEKDGVEDHFNSRLLVDRRPELEVRAQPFTVVSKRLILDAVAAVGDYDEFPSGMSSSRKYFALNLDTRAPGATSPFYGRLFAEKRDYDNSDMRVLGLEVGVQGMIPRRAKGRISYVTTNIHGVTPFEFDQILIPHELRAEVDVRLDRNWMFPLDLRYDLDRNEFRDKRIGILRTLDCIGYGVSYDSARKEIKLEVRLLGKGGF